jgi:hypothetical protein
MGDITMTGSESWTERRNQVAREFRKHSRMDRRFSIIEKVALATIIVSLFVIASVLFAIWATPWRPEVRRGRRLLFGDREHATNEKLSRCFRNRRQSVRIAAAFTAAQLYAVE